MTKSVQPLRLKCWKELEWVKTGMIKRTFQKSKSFTHFIALFDMSQNNCSYLVSRKITVSSDVWLLKKNMHFCVNEPWILVNFGTKKSKFKMAPQNFDNPRFFQYILKVTIYSSISESFSSVAWKLREI